jgi:hypothetical protein
LERKHGSVILARKKPVAPGELGGRGIIIGADLRTCRWDNGTRLVRQLRLAVAAVGCVDPGYRLKVSLAYLEPEAPFVAPPYSSCKDTRLRKNGAQ